MIDKNTAVALVSAGLLKKRLLAFLILGTLSILRLLLMVRFHGLAENELRSCSLLASALVLRPHRNYMSCRRGTKAVWLFTKAAFF